MRPITTYIATLLLLVSCSKVNDLDNNLGNDGRVQTIKFMLVNSSSQAGDTKALGNDALNENKIDRLDVFFYEGENCVFYPTPSQLTINAVTKEVSIQIPNDIALGFFGRTFTVYVVANCTKNRTDLTNKTYTNLRLLTQTNDHDFNITPFSAQPNFLMDAAVSVTLTQGVNNLGHLNLTRAAAKITMEITEAAVTGYTPGVATVSLNNYLNTSTLGTGTLYESQSSDYRSVSRSLGNLSTGSLHTTDPFYCYSNDWEFDAGKETYIMLAIPWTNNNNPTDSKTYYYRVPFNYLKAVGEASGHEFRIRRNYIYQFLMRINVLGSLDPDTPVELNCNFDVVDWTDRTVEVSIVQYDFLVVHERDVEMKNISTYAIEYSSSSPIQITNAQVYCYEYSVSGTITQKFYTAGSPEFPRLTIDPLTSKIYIATITPVNYVPRTMTFTVTNSASLKQYVTVTIYSAKYISAQQAPDYQSGDPWAAGSNLGGGSNNPMGASGQQNFNMFTITTTVLNINDRMPNGAPFYGVPITLGDPTELVDGIYQTRTDLASNSIMSPQFVIASQRGISSAHTYDNAVLRCRGYQEYPYERGSWRVPTAAELAYGNKLQNDPNSAVKGLFAAGNNAWWTAAKYYGFNFQSNTLTVNETAETLHYIRCVHDVWKD